jgi:hypothetical protein
MSRTTIEQLEVTDASAQKRATFTDVPGEASIEEIIEEFLASLSLPRNDSAGRPLSYEARLDREGRALQGIERVGEALQTGDRIVLQPSIDAGGAAPQPGEGRR